jgi:hypothetical protein
VLCDNSGYDLDELAAQVPQGASAAVELISAPKDGFAPSLGKGYGEMLILQHALRHSKLLNRSDKLLKVTGRLYLRNAGTFVRRVFASTAEVDADFSRKLAWADSRAFAFTPKFADDYLFPRTPIINDSTGTNFEHALARAIHGHMADGHSWAPLPLEPHFQGRVGTTGASQTPSLLRRHARNARRRVAVWLITR